MKFERCFIIAEIGSNHCGKLKEAKKLIQAAKTAGADAVKFQAFTACGLVSRKKLTKNKKWVSNPVFDKVKKYELPDIWLKTLYNFAKKIKIAFLCSAFEEKKASLLNKIGVSAFKIASGELDNFPFLKYVAGFRKPIILSTGASFLKEVEKAVGIIKNTGNRDIVLLHCVSNYPAKLQDFNLRAMLALKNKFHLPVGISDHTLGCTIPIAALALGARVVEKHLTFSRNLKGPDHSFALTPEEFKKMVEEVRILEKALGNGIKRPHPDEFAQRIGARRSIYAACDIFPGEIITKDKIKLVRHAYGIGPEKLDYILGKRVKRRIKKDETISLKGLR